MTLNDLTVNFTHLDAESLLSEWSWMIEPDKIPILLSAAGDAFLQSCESGSVYCLDVGSGSIDKISNSVQEFQKLLETKEFVVSYFAVEMIGDLIQVGKALSHGKIYSLKTPAILGGEYEIDNIEPVDIGIHFSIAGQIHRQVKELPDGATIGSITIE